MDGGRHHIQRAKIFISCFENNFLFSYFQSLDNAFGLISYFLFSKNKNIKNVSDLTIFNKSLWNDFSINYIYIYIYIYNIQIKNYNIFPL